jgi:UDP-glucose 4-epimerase
VKAPVLVTGSAGTIGRALCAGLAAAGVATRGLDLRATGAAYGDVCDAAAVARAMAGCAGVVHLAAVSRVAWGERDPAGCQRTNVEGTRVVVEAALQSAARPWVIVASSREVYGRAEVLPVSEDAPRRPCNAYGRSKRDAEDVLEAARAKGLVGAALRFASVYGGAGDHVDRVVPAMVRGALRGERLRVAGAARVFDFTHVDDVVAGVWATMARLDAGDAALPVVHLASGGGTSLGALARMALAAAGRVEGAVDEIASEGHEVDHFVGDTARARRVLGWSARVPLAEGLARMVQASEGERGESSGG